MKLKKLLSALIAGAMVVGTISVPVFAEGEEAKIGETLYPTLADAIAAAQSGDAIDLMGNTIVLKDETATTNGQIEIAKNISITNGTIDITENVVGSNAIFWIHDSTVTFDNVNFEGENFDSAHGVIYALRGTVTITDCNFELKNDMSISGGILKGDDPDTDKFIVSDTIMNLENPTRVINGVDVNMNNVTIDAKVTDDTRVAGYLRNNAFRNISGVIQNSTLKAVGFENGIKNKEGTILNISASTTVSVTDSVDYDVEIINGSTLNIDNTSRVYAETIDVAENAVTGNLASSANEIAVKFMPTTDERVYNIVLEGANSETINRLTSADLTFVLSDDSPVGYEIVKPNDSKVDFRVDTADTDRYLFNFNGTGAADEIGKTITLAQVKFDGYGKVDFKVNGTVDTNIANATKLEDNIVEHFVPNGGIAAGQGNLIINDANNNGVINTTIEVPKYTLTTRVYFNNKIENNAAAYQSMRVVISGGDLDEDVVVNLGDGITWQIEGNSRYYEFTEKLTKDTTYTVTVSGEGYRTARYTVTMTEDKTLNFWNNVKDNAIEMITDDGKAVTKNFLAGEIVKDNQINIYDLSAVVSYFGKTGLNVDPTGNAKFIRYDLNRDGKIDSKDVAYVLVSWGE